MGSIDANACRPGTKIVLNGDLYIVVERAHHKPGKGGAFVRFKLKGIVTGKVLDHTVRSGTRMEKADIQVQKMQYLYQDGENYVFMDLESYEQMMISGDLLGLSAQFVKEGSEAEVTLYEERPVGIELPQKMVFEVVETIENPAKGNTATNSFKEATLDTGYVAQVPMFIKIGDRVRLLTEDGKYLERVND